MLFIAFRIGGSQYALDASHIERVVPLLEIRPTPRAEGAVAGVCNFHGEAVAVVDLNRLAGNAPAAMSLSTRLVIIRQDTQRVALLVEDATEAMRMDPRKFSSKPLSQTSRSPKWLGGFASDAGRFIQRVEIDALLEEIGSRVI